MKTCSFLDKDVIKGVCKDADDEVLHNLSIYRVNNAFNRIQMGRNRHGIFMCAVIDVMHTVQHGIIMYVLESFKKSLNNERLAMLDRMAIAFDKTCCQTIRSSFPRTDFSRGITNLTSIECSEQSGALFLFTALMMQVDAWHELVSSFPNLPAVLGTMECLLCFEAWLDQYEFWDIGGASGEAEDADRAISSMMHLILTFLPRQKGNEWKVSKFHEIKHMVRFIVAFGCPRGYNASRPEEHHKAHAKRPGRRAHKNVSTIDQQCGRRIADTFIIDTMYALFEDTAKGEETAARAGSGSSEETNGKVQTREEGSGTRYNIRCFRDPENQLCRQVLFHTQTRGIMKLEDNLAHFIVQAYSEPGYSDVDANGEGVINCCTEYHKFDVDNDDDRLISLRCHPNYRGKGHPWYDWVIVRTEDDNGDETEYPSRVVSCIRRFDVEDNDTTFDLVVQCCTTPTGRESFLYTEWNFSKKFYAVPATALVSLCFVLISSEANGTVLVVNDRQDWPSAFYESANVVYPPI